MLGSVSNVAPWTISVAATLTDGRIISELVLGNGRRVVGSAINVFPNLGKPSLLMDPGGCDHEQLDGKRYKGAVLLSGMAIDISSEAISLTGADGAIVYMFGDENKDTAFSFSIPAVIVMEKEFDHIIDYYNSTRSAAAAGRRTNRYLAAFYLPL